MRIALDYTAAASHWPGVGRYGRELVRALVRRQDCPELLLFEHGSAPALPEDALGLEAAPAGRVRRMRISGSRRVMAWRAKLGLGGIERRLAGVDLVHRAFWHMPPVDRLASVTPLFELGPGGAEEAELGRALARADRIVVGSAAGRRELLARFEFLRGGGGGPERVRSVTTGADHWLRDARPRTVSERLAAGPPRLLVLGAIGHARRPLAVLAGFEALLEDWPSDTAPGDKPRLHFEGRPGDAARELRHALDASPASEHVTWNPEPVEAALPELVAGSTTLVHLSRGELSPITPLEALHFGLSVVATRLPAFEEVLVGEVLVDDGASARSLGDALARGLAAGLDEAAREARLEAAAPYTWDACAADHLALWREVAHSPR